MSDTVLVHGDDGVVTLTLNRPAALNALSEEMMQALHAAVKRVVADPRTAAIVVRGAGEHFMAGGDIKDFHSRLAMTPDARLAYFRSIIEQWINPTMRALRESPHPVVGAVQGACAGFGFSLMLGCDITIAAENAYFTTGYALLGTSPDGGGTYFLPRLVGTKKAAELMMLADRFTAAEALELGLINRIVPTDQLETESTQFARRLARGPRRVHAEVKRLLHNSHLATLDMQLQAEAEAFGRCSATADFAEGVMAFVEKRQPSFRRE